MTTLKIKMAITSILTSVFLVVACPFNANAYDIVTTVQPTGNVWEWGNQTVYGFRINYLNQNTDINRTGSSVFAPYQANAVVITNRPAIALTGIASSNTVEIKKGYYYGFNLSIEFNTNGQITQPYFNRLPTPSYLRLMSVQQVSSQQYCGYAYKPQQGTGVNSNYETCLGTAITYNLIFQGIDDFTGRIQLGINNQYMFNWEQTGEIITNYGTITAGTISEYQEQNMDSINQQQQEAGQQAQADGQTGSQISQTDATTGTQSLLSAITGFVGVIANATPTNCRITGDMGALDMGTLDFCQDNPPAIITTIGTLILIAITIPITIWVIKKIISMFRSFTNG